MDSLFQDWVYRNLEKFRNCSVNPNVLNEHSKMKLNVIYYITDSRTAKLSILQEILMVVKRLAKIYVNQRYNVLNFVFLM